MPDVGFLYSGSPNSLGHQFQEFKRHLPHGINVVPHHANNDYNRLFELAEDLIRQNVTVLVAAGGPKSAAAAKAATLAHSPPKSVVFTSVTDPVGSGLVERGGNLTGVAGMTTELDAARLRLLQELVPGITEIGVLTNPNRANVDQQYDRLQESADPNLHLYRRDAGQAGRLPGTNQDIKDAIRGLIDAEGAQGLLVTADPLFNDKRRQVIDEIAASTRPIAAIYQWREFAEDGGLMSYGPNIAEEYSIAADYVGRILGGMLPARIPIYQPTTFELVINQTTADALHFTIPQTLDNRAEKIR